MGKIDVLQSFRRNADDFICSLIPGASRNQPENVQYSPGGLLYKTGGSNMQHVTSLSFLVLAYSNYLSHARKTVSCDGFSNSAASPSLLRRLAKRQVCTEYRLPNNNNDNGPNYIFTWVWKLEGGLHFRGQPDEDVVYGRVRVEVPEKDPSQR